MYMCVTADAHVNMHLPYTYMIQLKVPPSPPPNFALSKFALPDTIYQGVLSWLVSYAMLM